MLQSRGKVALTAVLSLMVMLRGTTRTQISEKLCVPNGKWHAAEGVPSGRAPGYGMFSVQDSKVVMFQTCLRPAEVTLN